MSRIEDAVCSKIQQRARVGLNKYGVSLEKADLSKIELLVHLQEELMDAANYIEALLEIAGGEDYITIGDVVGDSLGSIEVTKITYKCEGIPLKKDGTCDTTAPIRVINIPKLPVV